MKSRTFGFVLSGLVLLVGGTQALAQSYDHEKTQKAYLAAQQAMRAQHASFDRTAARKDPTYARLKQEQELLKREFFGHMQKHQVQIGDEGMLEGDLPAEVTMALADLNEVTAALERTKGHRMYIHSVAQQAVASRNKAKPPVPVPAATAATTYKYYINIYRDPSVPAYYLDYTLKDYVNSAMGTISSEVWWNTWFSIDVQWQINGVYRTRDLSGCGSGNPVGGSGNTFNVYFRNGEMGHNGYGAAGSWAIIELSPPWSCNWSWNWDNQPTTTHEIGHIFGAQHYRYSQCGSYNDTECSSNGCGFEWCDSAAFPVCVEEYADAGFYGVYDDFCPNDEQCLINFVKYRSVCSEN